MVLFAGVSLLTAYAVALLAYLSAGGCGFGGFCQLNACARVESHLRTHLVGQARGCRRRRRRHPPVLAARMLTQCSRARKRRSWRLHSSRTRCATT